MAGRRTAKPVKRAGTVALVGRSNTGKSTLLNAALQLPLAIVSRKPQTTRDNLLGVVRHAGAEIRLLDTPGLHRAHSSLGRAMNRSARAGARDADVLVLVTALPRQQKGELAPHRGDLALLRDLPADRPVVLVINKIDLLGDKAALLPLIAAHSAVRDYAAIVPISARRHNGITRVLDEVAKLLPEGQARYRDDDVTDRPLRFFAAEYVREPILEATGQEVPHAAAVSIDELVEPPGRGALLVRATIHVERAGQKAIIIGRGGKVLGRIRTAARERIAALVDRPVRLELFVRVTAGWRDRPAKLADLGIEQPRGGSGR